ncbi:MAG TPA: tetratricopeptide repeat protein [Chitinophagales bacterium]|nr:tetratricopeptide repeat protein [Chitinophagales bacterium]
MADFDKLWDYDNPAQTEEKFREVLNALPADADVDYRLQLLTQIARTYGLRYMFNEAHQTLDAVMNHLAANTGLARVRYHLERGRSYNSAGKKDEAQKEFELAETTGREMAADKYVIDAMHMLAIVAPPLQSCAINEQAILYTENSTQPEAKNWLGALYNNLAWGYYDLGQYEKALSVFLRALKWREEKKTARGIFIAKWCVAKTLRALGRLDDSLTIQLALFEESVETGQSDGYVHEELGELYLLKNDQQKAAFHFEKAYHLLSQDPHHIANDGPRLERMKKLAGLA